MPKALADAGQLNRKGWRWPMYKDLIAFAAERQWPLRGGQPVARRGPQDCARRSGADLPAATPRNRLRLEDDVVQGHCGHRPEQARLNGIVAAQRARDARMAQVLDAAPDKAGIPWC